ncbi:hypothetical protein NVP1081O_243 [Vibrio phage 1.081.O._10N.286.52.C2]|nr:hypothetical protein NVP1081O_243 [Vibrio phage 1.081.O._10N.286.52.C2]
MFTLPPVHYLYGDPERETDMRVFEKCIDNCNGTGISIWECVYNQYILEALHPGTDPDLHFEVLPEIESTITTHSNSDTIVIITRDSFEVMFSGRASEQTMFDLFELIKNYAEQWGKDRVSYVEQRYSIKWNSHQQTYVLHTIAKDRDWRY